MEIILHFYLGDEKCLPQLYSIRASSSLDFQFYFALIEVAEYATYGYKVRFVAGSLGQAPQILEI